MFFVRKPAFSGLTARRDSRSSLSSRFSTVLPWLDICSYGPLRGSPSILLADSPRANCHNCDFLQAFRDVIRSLPPVPSCSGLSPSGADLCSWGKICRFPLPPFPRRDVALLVSGNTGNSQLARGFQLGFDLSWRPRGFHHGGLGLSAAAHGLGPPRPRSPSSSAVFPYIRISPTPLLSRPPQSTAGAPRRSERFRSLRDAGLWLVWVKIVRSLGGFSGLGFVAVWVV